MADRLRSRREARSVRSRLRRSFGLLVILLVATGLLALAAVVTVDRSMERLRERDMPALAAQVEHLLDRGPMWGYLIDGHGLYAWGHDMHDARRHLDAFEFLLACELDLRRLNA